MTNEQNIRIWGFRDREASRSGYREASRSWLSRRILLLVIAYLGTLLLLDFGL